MKRAALIAVLFLLGAGYVFLQTTASAPKLATWMPGGALLYLESPDFGRLLRDWDASSVKTDWLSSATYQVFSRSNLFTKLQEVYGQYGNAAGFVPELGGVIQIAGAQSALALYQIRDVEFLYISRVSDSDFMKSQLWAVRDKFEQRQAGGSPFYVRRDADSKRTVAFALAKGYLVLATGDGLVAQALELMAGGGKPSIDADRWYRESTAAAPHPGELRLVMNLESLVKSDYFRSYWVQRNTPAIRRYWAGVADVKRSEGGIAEDRVLLHAPDAGASRAPVSNLLALAPPDAGFYKLAGVGEASDAAALIVRKLIGAPPQRAADWRSAPSAVSPDEHAGSESDLETRIDEQPLPADPGMADAVAAVRTMADTSRGHALLLVESTAPADSTFVRMSAAIVLEGATDWDRDTVRAALSQAAGKLWSTAQIGTGWVSGTAGRNAVEQLDSVATLAFAARGRLLFLGNDLPLLAEVLDRSATAQGKEAFTYAAGVRLARERTNYERMMTALDFNSASGNGNGEPAFFSGNIGGLWQALSKVDEVRVTEEDRGGATRQTVWYAMRQ